MNDLTISDPGLVDTALFLQTIKKATAQLHQLLESNSLLSTLVSPRVTIREYYCYLVLMQEIMTVYERDLLTLVAIKQTKATQLIANDLLNIGYALPQSDALNKYSIPAEKIRTSFAWGYAYVMEGSKLGGKVIFKHIQRNLGFTEIFGATFLADGGANTMGLWKEFLTKFSGYVTENNNQEEAIQGAEYAFQSIYQYFELNPFIV